MLNVDKLCASAEECLGWPYASPGSNDARGIDCSGLFVKCFRDQGASIYHGSNTIWRKYCSEKGELKTVRQLRRGMAVFKWNPKTPPKFTDGQGDFQHIGLVVSANPLRIIHASTGTMCVTTDTRLGKWRFWGWLKDVEKDPGQAPLGLPAAVSDDVGAQSPQGAPAVVLDQKVNLSKPHPMAEEGPDQIKAQSLLEASTLAIVTAPGGTTVNLRAGARKRARLLTRVPIGETVEVLQPGPQWTKVKYGARTGYMMTEFLAAKRG